MIFESLLELEISITLFFQDIDPQCPIHITNFAFPNPHLSPNSSSSFATSSPDFPATIPFQSPTLSQTTSLHPGKAIMCITWKLDFAKCGHQEETDVHSYCYKYRHTRMCDVEEVRLIEKMSRCAECKVGDLEEKRAQLRR